MKKLLGILVLGLLLSGNAYAIEFKCSSKDHSVFNFQINKSKNTLKLQSNYKGGGLSKQSFNIVSLDSKKVTVNDWNGNPWYIHLVDPRIEEKDYSRKLNCETTYSASDYTENNTKQVGISFTIKDKKEQCAAIGFKPATDKFADCVLRLVELDLKKQINNPTIVAQDPGNQAIVNELKRSNNMQQSQFLMNLSNQLLNPSSPASSMSSSSCTVRGGTIKTINCW